MAVFKSPLEVMKNSTRLHDTIKRVFSDTTHITVLEALSNVWDLPEEDPVNSVRLVDFIFYIKKTEGWIRFCKFEDFPDAMLTLETENGKYLYGATNET